MAYICYNIGNKRLELYSTVMADKNIVNRVRIYSFNSIKNGKNDKCLSIDKKLEITVDKSKISRKFITLKRAFPNLKKNKNGKYTFDQTFNLTKRSYEWLFVEAIITNDQIIKEIIISIIVEGW